MDGNRRRRMFARFIRAWVVPDTVKKQPPIERRTALGPLLPSKGQQERAAWSGPKQKVYCEKCLWLGKSLKPVEDYYCNHESNIVRAKSKQTWLRPESESHWRKHPSRKNKRNDCQYFKISSVYK